MVVPWATLPPQLSAPSKRNKAEETAEVHHGSSDKVEWRELWRLSRLPHTTVGRKRTSTGTGGSRKTCVRVGCKRRRKGENTCCIAWPGVHRTGAHAPTPTHPPHPHRFCLQLGERKGRRRSKQDLESVRCQRFILGFLPRNSIFLNFPKSGGGGLGANENCSGKLGRIDIFLDHY